MALIKTCTVLVCVSACAIFMSSAFAEEKSNQPTTTRDKVDFLEPVIGTWQGTATVGGDQSTATIKYRWINNESFILQTVDCPEIHLAVNHVIGWDPTSRSVKTWGFGGNGGHGEMAWKKNGPINWTEESKDWTAPDGQNCHFVLETKLAEDKLEISGFFATAGQEKTEIVISATKGKH